MIRLSSPAGAGPGPRHSCAAGRPFRRAALAALAALAAGPGCDSDPPPLPLKPCGVETKYFGDEVTLSYAHLGYDEHGNQVLRERDDLIDGTIDIVSMWEYGPDGITRVSQTRSSGAREVVVDYDDAGRLASVTWTSYLEGPGRVDYEYEGDERIIGHWDHGDDGVVDEIVNHEYGTDGKLRASSDRCAGDAEPDSITTWAWGEGGRIERIETRRDGEVNAATQFTYDPDGLLEGWERTFGSTVVAWEAFDHDAAGNVRGTSSASVLALFQDPPSWSITDRVYDAEGRIRSSTNTIDGTLYSEATYLYECPDHEDSPGRLVGAPASPLPPPPMGPRAGVGLDAIFEYVIAAGGSCL